MLIWTAIKITQNLGVCQKTIGNSARIFYTDGGGKKQTFWIWIATKSCYWKYLMPPLGTIKVCIGLCTEITLMSKSGRNTDIKCWRPCSWTEWVMQNFSIMHEAIYFWPLHCSCGVCRDWIRCVAFCRGKGEPSGLWLQQLLFTPSTADSHIDSRPKVHGRNYTQDKISGQVAVTQIVKLWHSHIKHHLLTIMFFIISIYFCLVSLRIS